MFTRCLTHAVLLLSAAGLHAQSPSPTLQLRADVRLVMVPVTVLDTHSRPLASLRRENFRIFDDGVPQTISHFDPDDAPIAIGIVLDASSSMRRTAPTAPLAMQELLKNAHPDDEFFLVEFNQTARLAAPLTHDASDIVRQLGRSAPEGRTALFDAILLALQEAAKAKSPRRALLVVSDGLDNQSVLSSAQVEAVIRESSVPIYTVGVVTSGLGTFDLMALEWLRRTAAQTGGRKFEARERELPEFCRQIARDMRAQYLIGYPLPEGRADGRRHSLRVEVVLPPDAGKARATWRPGYLAPGI